MNRRLFLRNVMLAGGAVALAPAVKLLDGDFTGAQRGQVQAYVSGRLMLQHVDGEAPKLGDLVFIIADRSVVPFNAWYVTALIRHPSDRKFLKIGLHPVQSDNPASYRWGQMIDYKSVKTAKA